MKKRPKIKINPDKPKIQIKGSDTTASGTTGSQSKKDAGAFQALSGFFQIIKAFLNTTYGLIGLLLFFGVLTTYLITTLMKSNEPEPEPAKVIVDSVDEELEETLDEDMDLATLYKLIAKKRYKKDMIVLDSGIMIRNLLMKEDLPDHILKELIYLAKRKKISELQEKKSWYTVASGEEAQIPIKLFIYELSPSQSYVIQALPRPDIVLVTKPELIKIRSVAGVIKTYLWDAVLENGGDYRIVEKIEDALKWVVDLYHLHPNDRFKLIYEEKWVGDKVVDVGRLLAVSFQSGNKTHYAFYFEDKHTNGYFDYYGKTMRRKFLQSPVKYDRINSPYNPERIHPVLGDKRPHLGTDYYAEKGDPVFATADGMVSIARFKENNGNYIKIKHDNVYETQYLHLLEGNPFAKGIKKDAKVNQGQVIGYAGKTGLATGYHVCYRFWKKGKQVDPRYEEIVAAQQPGLMDKEAFAENRDSLLDQLEGISYFDISFD